MDLNKLKTCAEMLGYEARIIHLTDGTPFKVVAIDNEGEHFNYDPEHNDAQAFELLKWLIDGRHIEYISRTGEFLVKNKLIKGQTLNQAVIEAVWEVKNG